MRRMGEAEAAEVEPSRPAKRPRPAAAGGGKPVPHTAASPRIATLADCGLSLGGKRCSAYDGGGGLCASCGLGPAAHSLIDARGVPTAVRRAYLALREARALFYAESEREGVEARLAGRASKLVPLLQQLQNAAPESGERVVSEAGKLLPALRAGGDQASRAVLRLAAR